MIPAGVYVQGIVDRVARAGRVKGKAQLDMHFTSIIFPNGSVVEIPGIVNSLPGARKQEVKDDGEGTIEQDSDKGRNAAQGCRESAIPTGGTIGSIGGLESGHPLAGGISGNWGRPCNGGLGFAVYPRRGSRHRERERRWKWCCSGRCFWKMENLAGTGTPGSAPALVPAADQPKPLEKPNRAHVMCPSGRSRVSARVI
jgi:hypothetical protein